MSLADIRALIETKVNDAFGVLNPPVEVVFDNVQETLLALPYVVLNISYTDTTVTTVRPSDGLKQINGNIQIAAYDIARARNEGLEELATTSMQVLNGLYDWSNPVKVRAGPINGPVSLLTGDQPYAMVNTSCAFVAQVD